VSVTMWETETLCGESVYRIGPDSKAETHRGWGGAELTVYVSRREGVSRSIPADRQSMCLTLEEAELLALALAEAVGRMATEEEGL
jgi:hypothetical protein